MSGEAGEGTAVGVDEGEGMGAGEGDTGGIAGGGGGGAVPALMAAACAWNVVETIGQPFPGPTKFCRVTLAAFIRAS